MSKRWRQLKRLPELGSLHCLHQALSLCTNTRSKSVRVVTLSASWGDINGSLQHKVPERSLSVSCSDVNGSRAGYKRVASKLATKSEVSEPDKNGECKDAKAKMQRQQHEQE